MERRVANTSSFDATPVLDASINDLSLPLFEHYCQQVIDPDIIEANHRHVQEQLASLRFFKQRASGSHSCRDFDVRKTPTLFLPWSLCPIPTPARNHADGIARQTTRRKFPATFQAFCANLTFA